MREALQKDAELAPDVVVLDIALPGVAESRLCGRLLAHRPKLDVQSSACTFRTASYATQSVQRRRAGLCVKASARRASGRCGAARSRQVSDI